MSENLKSEQGQAVEGWHTRLVSVQWPFERDVLKPADITRRLKKVMLADENIIEDAQYQKVVPNQYIVEVSQDSYRQYFQPIEEEITRQWYEKLLYHLVTTNGRLGRKVYRFGGLVRVEIQPAPDLERTQARIWARVETELSEAETPVKLTGRLELLRAPDKGWLLTGEETVIGRGKEADIFLDTPEIASLRLISSKHATLRRKDDRMMLYDGGPDGKPSLNGTYVNGEKVPADGRELCDGDVIILAATDPQNPSPDVPGVAAFRFRME